MDGTPQSSGELTETISGRVNDEYDEQIAANETDMTFELNEADLNDAREDEYAYEKFVRNLDTITEDERAALIADLAKVAELNEKIDAIYARMTDKNADKLYEENAPKSASPVSNAHTSYPSFSRNR